MSTTRLPELPKANGFRPDSGYTLEQMHAYGLAVWKAAIQCAVERIERMKRGENTDYSAGYDDACDDIIAALAALPLPEQGSPQERREG